MGEMGKQEKRIVFLTGIVLLIIFTFTDLQISMSVATKPTAARVLEVVGELPFTILAASGCAMIVRYRNKRSAVKNIAALLGGGVLLLLFSAMGGFMTWNYLRRNIEGAPTVIVIIIGGAIATFAIGIALQVPEKNREKALRFAAMALVYFLIVIIVMNTLKTIWGRMRFREMTDPVNEFTRWYQICGRGKFDDAFASFPSGHSMNSAGVILVILLPDFIPALQGKEKMMRIFAYAWCVIVGFSRVLMGAHFASDVTIGVMLSLILFEILYTLLYRKGSRSNI